MSRSTLSKDSSEPRSDSETADDADMAGDVLERASIPSGTNEVVETGKKASGVWSVLPPSLVRDHSAAISIAPTSAFA
jgi:hypothetical protein